MIAAQLTQPANVTLYIIAYILQAAGLSPLLMATLGFLRTVYVSSCRFWESSSLSNII